MNKTNLKVEKQHNQQTMQFNRKSVPQDTGFSLFIKKLVKQKTLIFMALPGVLLVLIFAYIPLYGITIAFQDFNPVKGFFSSDIKWVGLTYFQQFFASPYFFRLLRNTFLLGFYSLIIGFPLPIILALLLDQLNNIRFKKTVQTLSYLPHFLSVVVVVGILKELFSTTGVINNILATFGIDAIPFLIKNSWFRPLYIGSGIWTGIGWGSIIYLAALTNVDPQLIEAAVIDGASRFQRVCHISLPVIAPTISIMLIFAISGIMGSDFTKVLLLYNENTYEVADIISTYVYREGIINGQYEYTTAIGMFLNLIGFVLIYGANYASKKISGNSFW